MDKIDREVLEEFRYFSEEELREILSDLNLWGAGLEFHEEPDLVRAAVHYARSSDGSLYCKHPLVREIAGDKKVFPNETIFNAVQIWFAVCHYQDYIVSHNGRLPETLEIPEFLPPDEKQNYILMMLFVFDGQASVFAEKYTCPERLLGISTEELKCQCM